jgi:hypothetical protein
MRHALFERKLTSTAVAAEAFGEVMASTTASLIPLSWADCNRLRGRCVAHAARARARPPAPAAGGTPRGIAGTTTTSGKPGQELSIGVCSQQQLDHAQRHGAEDRADERPHAPAMTQMITSAAFFEAEPPGVTISVG